MMKIENRLIASLQKESKAINPPQDLKQKVMDKIMIANGGNKIKRRILAGVVAFGLLIPTSAFAYQVHLADELYGSLQNVIENFDSATTDSYMLLNAKFLQAKGELSSSEYEQFKENLKVIVSYKLEFGNQYGDIDYDRIPEEKVLEIKNTLMSIQPYFDRLNGNQSSKDVLTASEYDNYINALMTTEKILAKSEINASKSFGNEDIQPNLLEEYLSSQSIIDAVNSKISEAANVNLAYKPSFFINKENIELEFAMPAYDFETIDLADVNFVNAFIDRLEPVEVKANSTLKVTFDEQLDSINYQIMNKEGNIIESTDSQEEVTLPNEKGLYTIVVTGSWEEIKKSFFFIVNVIE